MINRRTFAALLAGAAAMGGRARAESAKAKTVFYSAVGPDLTLYDMDVEAATLTRRSTVTLPGNVQYAWPHPTKRYFYVISTNGEPGGGDAPKGDTHVATAFRIDPMSGALTKHGPEPKLPSRPIHTSVDATGRFLLIAFNEPSNVIVHRINDDGTIGALVNQKEKLDTGIYGHQIRTTPGNKTAILITRGNNATAKKPEDPGAIKVFGFDNGVLTNLESIAAGNNGYGFGPRHHDYHPSQPRVYVSIERQNQLYVFGMNKDGSVVPKPLFIKGTLAAPRVPDVAQGVGTIHIHPNGRFAYIPNRASGTVKVNGKDVFAGGENNMAVFSLNEQTGEPTLIQNIDGHGIQLRTFGIDPTGRLLIAASIQPMLIRNGDKMENLSAGLTVYRIGTDGKLSFVRKYDIDTAKGTQFWSGMVTLA
ncbi:MAG TPA: beta-propeller fold lactonase family protein [Micropepsaceae bacterium]|nr:beta-propeller fold lactonase family protein [Micropepsaceae bacterium]